MIVSWISHDNRKRRRAAQRRAKQAGYNLAVHRVTSDQIGRHIIALTVYLVSPAKQQLDNLIAIEAAEQHVARYIGSHKEVGDKASDIDLTKAGTAADNERVRQVLTRNILSDDLEDIQFELALVAGLCPGGEDPIEHIILSWPAGEHPSEQQVEDALDIVLAVSGMTGHQAYAVLHGDTENDHLHIALNRVDPVTGERLQIGRNVERSIETLHQALAIIEHRQRWAAQDQALYRADHTGCYERGTGIKVRDASMVPCALSVDQQRIRAWRAEQKVERKISPAARDFERRTGIESLQRRVIDTAAPVLRSALDWQAVHRGLGREGMRYAPLTSGAVIICGERDIAASTAWGGGSAAKMIERLGPFEPPARPSEVISFEDRAIPRLYQVAEHRRARQARRDDRAALDRSIDHAHVVVGDCYRRMVADDPLAETDRLNDVRHRASAELASLREAIEQLKARKRKAIKRRTKSRDGIDPADLEDTTEEPAAMLVGGIAVPTSRDATQTLLDEGYDVVEAGDTRRYYRASILAFVEHRDRIDIHALDDEALRQALRLGQARWGSITAIGDRRFIDRIARLAVEEQVTLTNPDLQERMRRLQANQTLERQLDRIEQQLSMPRVESPAAQASQPTYPVRLRADYAPEFASWFELRADPAVSRARVGASAYAIFVQPDLKRQLAELDSQQFEFARELRRAALRYAAHRQQVFEEQQAAWDDTPREPFGRLPRLSDLSPSAEDLKRMPIEFAPLPTVVPARPVPASPITPATDDVARDLDRRYLEWATRQRDRDVAQAERVRTAALRARLGDPTAPPRYIARLLLREAGRSRGERSPTAAATNERDDQEIAALSHLPAFVQLLGRVRLQDPATIEMLRGVNDTGDVLGRVRETRGRLDFAYVSDAGHDAGARPPLEWVQEDLGRIDFTRIRLTRHGDMIGLSDTDLHDATHHNHVALLYPVIQLQLKAKWRLQCQRDLDLLAKIRAGQIIVNADIDLSSRPYARIDLPRGATDAEQQHVQMMIRDQHAFLSLREAVRGEITPYIDLGAGTQAAFVKTPPNKNTRLNKEYVRRGQRHNIPKEIEI